ncbi:MAG: deoxyribodipyrimidine photolyase [Sphingobacteriia bacterium]|nr:deoxyribodipyrimidine photolyase [Sphingobacteriia bacterium]
MDLKFPTDYKTILNKLDQIDPIQYGKTRNYINGAVTYLSPYISRGVISTKQVLIYLIAKGYNIPQMESFVKELCWRDYFQRVGQHKNLNLDIKQAQSSILHYEIPVQIINVNSGITGIDNSIQQLYNTGYMHNHCRMYTASLICNIAKSHWLHPAQWMYYHLLDGDWASNASSWQWVAGANSNKKYYANQENVNKYSFTQQTNSFLDYPYEKIEQMEVPESLIKTQKLELETQLPISDILTLDTNLPTYIYNYYNLDPVWHSEESGNRILLLEPDFFRAYPISKKCMDFMLDLCKNIPQIQVFVGSFESLCNQYNLQNIVYKEHPLNIGYTGIEEPRDWIAEKVTGYYPSFFSYWKKVEKYLLN